MSNDLTFASVGPSGVVHYARCEGCQCGSHYPTPTWHTWADGADVLHAARTGQADPSDKRCACPCVDDAGFCAEPEVDESETVSLNAEPCPECGEMGACGYDVEGRPMIHTTPDGSET